MPRSGRSVRGMLTLPTWGEPWLKTSSYKVHGFICMNSTRGVGRPAPTPPTHVQAIAETLARPRCNGQ